jgi:branched-chain amino acid transport system ATP-binding protein
MAPLLDIRGLCRDFGGVKAVADFNLRLEPEEMVGLIGPNGSGKTTLFNSLTGVFPPTRGECVFRDQSIAQMPPHRIIKMGIARTFQNIRLFQQQTVLDNVLVGSQLHQTVPLWQSLARTRKYKTEERRLRLRARELLDIFGLAERANQIASTMPYADQRRVEIARALATHPGLLLLDEPSAGMNSQEQDEIKMLIAFIRKEFHVAIILVEHNMRVVMDICPRIVAMDFGQIIGEGSPAEIQNNSKVIEAYLGTAETIP